MSRRITFLVLAASAALIATQASADPECFGDTCHLPEVGRTAGRRPPQRRSRRRVRREASARRRRSVRRRMPKLDRRQGAAQMASLSRSVSPRQCRADAKPASDAQASPRCSRRVAAARRFHRERSAPTVERAAPRAGYAAAGQPARVRSDRSSRMSARLRDASRRSDSLRRGCAINAAAPPYSYHPCGVHGCGVCRGRGRSICSRRAPRSSRSTATTKRQQP